MKKILVGLMMILAVLTTSCESSQENFSTRNSIKKANSVPKVTETLYHNGEIGHLDLQNFEIDMSDFADDEVMDFELEFKKEATVTDAYKVYLLDQDKNLVDTIVSDKMNLTEKRKTFPVKIDLKEYHAEIKKDFYIRIGYAFTLSVPFEGVVDYIDLPLTNPWHLEFDESCELSIYTKIRYNLTYFTFYKEIIVLNDMPKEKYEDRYLSRGTRGPTIQYYSMYSYLFNEMETYIYVYDELGLFNAAFYRDEDYPGYNRAEVFFQSLSNKKLSTLSLLTIYRIERKTLMMTRSYQGFEDDFRDNTFIYFPINYYETFKDTKMIFSIRDFGEIQANIDYHFTVHFPPNSLRDEFKIVGETGKKDWGEKMETVIIWAQPLYSLALCWWAL